MVVILHLQILLQNNLGIGVCKDILILDFYRLDYCQFVISSNECIFGLVLKYMITFGDSFLMIS